MWIDDDILRRAAEPRVLKSWVPDRPIVVLGSSNVASSEADEATCLADGIQVLKRYGGGGTVVLHQGCAIVSLGLWVRQHFQNAFYFRHLNAAVISALAARWPELSTLTQSGISDLTARDRKVGGTSLFRSRNYLLYQASLLVDPRMDLIDRYLRHPTKEPDYRRGRSHGDFLTGLATLTSDITPSSCAAALSTHLPAALDSTLADELMPSFPDQLPALHSRAQRESSNT
jgi:lipoate-protein ligase A